MTVAALIERNWSDIYAQCRKFFTDWDAQHKRWVVNWDDINDASHDAVIEMLKYEHTIRPDTNLNKWMHSYTNWACIRVWRLRHRNSDIYLTDDHYDNGIHDFRLKPVEDEITDAPSWGLLDYQERLVVFLLDCNLNYYEIAAALGWGYNTVRRRIYSAREKLKGRLK